MKKYFLSIFMFLAVFCTQLKADEGMWLPYNLSNQSLYEMQQLGCELTAEQIFNLNQPSVKDAIVQFANGCTGEPNPLPWILVNHPDLHDRPIHLPTAYQSIDTEVY